MFLTFIAFKSAITLLRVSIQDIINDEKAEKAFIFGYVMCNEIKEETRNIYED